jgi:carbon-monoxide dehydrogenase large subunit
VEGVTVRIGLDGEVVVAASVPSIGQHPESMFVSIVSRELGVESRSIVVERDDAAAASYSAGVFAGRGAVIIGGAVAEASRELRLKILHIASHLLGRPTETLRIHGGRIVTGKDVTRLSLKDIANVAYLNAHRLPPQTSPGLAISRFLDPKFGVFANTAHAAVVEVDSDLFTVKLLSYAAVTDCGNVLNEKTVNSQVLGGIAYGVSLALAEQLAYDDAGFLVYPTRGYYPVARAIELPDIKIEFLNTPAESLTGAKPVGQSGTIAAPAAIANAVADALRPFSVSVNQLPITPSSLFAASGALSQNGPPKIEIYKGKNNASSR